MLKAHLRGKFDRLVARVLPERKGEDPLGEWEKALWNDEDSLTSSVFERVSYLDPSAAWHLLEGAVDRLSGDVLPRFPSDSGWSFWPSWSPGDEDRHAVRIEPDVVLEAQEAVVVFECKLRGGHYAEQWVSQIRAARKRFPGREVAFVAVGVSDVPSADAIAQAVCAEIVARGEKAPSLFALRWSRLRTVLERDALGRAPGAGERALLSDLAGALEDRGVHLRRWLVSLPRGGRIEGGALRSWVTFKSRRPGFEGLRAGGLAAKTTAATLTTWRVR
jgi:hypothetical protein